MIAHFKEVFSVFVLCVLTDSLAHSQNFSQFLSLFSIFLSQGEGVVTGMLSLQAKRMTTEQSNRTQLLGECHNCKPNTAQSLAA